MQLFVLKQYCFNTFLEITKITKITNISQSNLPLNTFLHKKYDQIVFRLSRPLFLWDFLMEKLVQVCISAGKRFLEKVDFGYSALRNGSKTYLFLQKIYFFKKFGFFGDFFEFCLLCSISIHTIWLFLSKFRKTLDSKISECSRFFCGGSLFFDQMGV